MDQSVRLEAGDQEGIQRLKSRPRRKRGAAPSAVARPAERSGVSSEIRGQGLAPEGRKGYEAYLEGRVLELGIKRGREELAEEWKAIRRGWYVGGAAFKERMLALVEGPLRRGRSGSYSGGAKRAHSEAEAERLLACGLAALELAGSQLAEMGKGALKKEVLACWVCQHTTARRRWVSERLEMGDESRVTRAIRRVKRDGQAEVRRLKSRLEQIYESNNAEVEV